jgi:hypothetical protein
MSLEANPQLRATTGYDIHSVLFCLIKQKAHTRIWSKRTYKSKS